MDTNDAYLNGRRAGREYLARQVRGLAHVAERALDDENRDRQIILERLIQDLRRVTS